MNKINNLRAALKEHNVQGIIISSNINRTYLTGFTGSTGIAIVTENDALLLVDSRYIEQANEQAINFRVELYNRSLYSKEIQSHLDEMNILNLGFEEANITVKDYRHLKEILSVELIPLPPIVEKLRAIKTAEEVEILRQAAAISDAAFTHILDFIQIGMTELEIANELEMKMRQLGATSSSFDMIIASGTRSALPHGAPTEKKIQNGDLITLDFGAYYKGYCSDMTRTIALGEPDKQLTEIYEIVLSALDNATKNIKAGLTAHEVDALTRNIIEQAGYGDYFGHGTGHGIGMYIHEEIFLSKGNYAVVEPGMVLTIEPGIYLPGLGGVRIEDDVYIVEDGVENLTTSPKNLIKL